MLLLGLKLFLYLNEKHDDRRRVVHASQGGDDGGAAFVEEDTDLTSI